MDYKIKLLREEIRRLKGSISKIEVLLDEIEKSPCTNTNMMDGELLDIWESATDLIEQELTEISYNTWIKNIEPIEIDDNCFYISVANDFIQNIVENRYVSLIEKALIIVTGMDYTVKVLVGVRENQSNSKEKEEESISDKQIKIDSKYSFDNIVIGKYNKIAYKSAYEFARNFHEKPRIIYIYGKVGLGKTHILKAVENYILENEPLKKVNYMSVDDFTNELIKSIFSDSKENFKNTTTFNDVLIIDDLQNITGKERTQEELVKVVKNMVESGKSVIIGCTKSPQDTFILNEKIDSLFEMGEVIEITELDMDASIKILEKKIEDENIKIEDEILMFIATNFNSNVRELINALNRIVSYSNFTGEVVDIDMAVKLFNIV